MVLPISDDDIVRLLENSPSLKALLCLPARVAQLEAKVRELEGLKHTAPARKPVAFVCPICDGSALKIIDEADHPQFGALGIKKQTFECQSCGKVISRDYDPRKA